MMPRSERRRPFNARPANRSRNGLVLIAALVCLLIVTSLTTTMLQGALRARRQLRAERDRRQAELLVEAGADRAAARMAADSTFRGDTWSVPAEAIVGRGAGRVTTEIKQGVDDKSWQIHVVAEYPLDRDFPVRRSLTLALASPSTLSPEQSP
jgi:hypothetical protein